MRHPLLQQIPDELLMPQRGSAERTRPVRLLAWLGQRQYRPALADIDAERHRRLARGRDGRS